VTEGVEYMTFPNAADEIGPRPPNESLIGPVFARQGRTAPPAPSYGAAVPPLYLRAEKVAKEPPLPASDAGAYAGVVSDVEGRGLPGPSGASPTPEITPAFSPETASAVAPMENLPADVPADTVDEEGSTTSFDVWLSAAPVVSGSDEGVESLGDLRQEESALSDWESAETEAFDASVPEREPSDADGTPVAKIPEPAKDEPYWEADPSGDVGEPVAFEGAPSDLAVFGSDTVEAGGAASVETPPVAASEESRAHDGDAEPVEHDTEIFPWATTGEVAEEEVSFTRTDASTDSGSRPEVWSAPGAASSESAEYEGGAEGSNGEADEVDSYPADGYDSLAPEAELPSEGESAVSEVLPADHLGDYAGEQETRIGAELEEGEGLAGELAADIEETSAWSPVEESLEEASIAPTAEDDARDGNEWREEWFPSALGEPEPEAEPELLGEEPARMTGQAMAEWLPASAVSSRVTDHRIDELAARLERIAHALRQKGAAGPLTEAAGDPLGALITGYLLGMSDPGEAGKRDR
jgi:hypothetical protein